MLGVREVVVVADREAVREREGVRERVKLGVSDLDTVDDPDGDTVI